MMADEAGRPILEACDLCFRYPGGIGALDRLSLDIRAGEILAILGPNGAGKTTLLLHLNGSLRPEAGEMRLEGQHMGYDAGSLAHWRASVGLVLQDPDDQLFAGSVFEDVAFGPLNLGLGESEVRTRVGSALADLGLTELGSRPIHMLSLGQKRRAAIAGVLAMAPRVLVLDEPTAGLDADGVAQLLSALRRLASKGTTIVYATHDVDLALGWSDRVALFDRGQVIACDASMRVLADDRLLRRARLRPPLVLEIAVRAQGLGLLGEDAPLPRTGTDLLEALATAGPAAGFSATAPSARAGARSGDGRE